MKPRIRMVALDLDGTLLNSQKLISSEDIQALQEVFDQGVEIVPVTGRNFSFALPIAEMLPFKVPLVASNGAVIRNREGETFLRRLLLVATARRILQITAEFRPYTVVIYDQPGAGHLRIQAAPEGRSSGQAPWPAGSVADSLWLQRNRALVQRFDSLEQALDGDPLEVVFIGPMAVMCEVGKRLASELDSRQSSGRSFRWLRTEYPERDLSIVDVIHSDCSKGRALEHWSRWRKIPAAEIMAIGDNYNDLEMLRFAGWPVVMGNAGESLKQQGWAVTLDCDSSGVAYALRKYIL
jgi:hydroxymethylpyrimidine pyrophosphatase-like HAD family hydrolase